MEAVVSPTYSKLGLRSVQLSSSKGDRKVGFWEQSRKIMSQFESLRWVGRF
jgi:hypothetical protein